MRIHAQTVKFLKSQQNQSFPGIQVSEEKFQTTHGEILADVYYPPDKPSFKTAPIIVFLHGMSPLGYRDPRQVNLLSALSYAGFKVVAPSFPEIQSTIIISDSINKLAGLIPVINEKFQSKRLALFSVSFSGSICLSAAIRPKVSSLISAICTVGSFSEIGSTLEYLFTAEDCDSYARLIILKNFIELSIGKNPEVVRAIEAAIHDNWHKTNDQLSKVKSEISSDNRDLVEKLLNDSEYRRKRFAEARPGMVEVESAYNIYDAAENLECAVALFHGHKDNVIHPEQSLMFYRHLQECGVKSAVCVSPFLSHGDATISLRLIKSLFQVIKTFSFFFREVNRFRSAH